MQKNSLTKRLKNKGATICVIGLGYVGLPLVLRFTDVGYNVIGVDIDQDKVTSLHHGKTYIKYISDGVIAKAVKQGFMATTDFSKVKEADVVIICVPTPLNKYHEPDLSFVINTVESMLPYVRCGQVISLESTTYPGTTEEELKPRLETRGFKVGQDIFLVFSPEREDPGNTKFNIKTTPKICGGITQDCLAVGIALYEQIVDRVVPVSSTKAAEMTKLLENIHRAVNIGLVNEMKMICDKMGLDIFEIIDAAATKPFGFVPYYPGPGLGGHCVPIDPFYLTWKAREYSLNTQFIELAGEINRFMPLWVVEKLILALNDRHKTIKSSNILILGIAYKENIDDIRESPAAEILDILIGKGAKVAYSDPHIPIFPKMRKYSFDLKSVTVTPDALYQYDAVLVITAHKGFDFDLIKKHAKLIVDTRGVYRLAADNIVRA